MDTVTSEAIVAGATVLSSLLFGSFAFGMLKYVPSRKEFDMHTKNDDERHEDIKKTLDRIEQSIHQTKLDIIREVKNGHGA